MQVCVRRQVQGRFQIPVPDGRHLVRQQADIPDQGPSRRIQKISRPPISAKAGTKTQITVRKEFQSFHTQGHSREQL